MYQSITCTTYACCTHPPMPLDWGWTAPRQRRAVMAASTADPSLLRTSAAISVQSSESVATAPAKHCHGNHTLCTLTATEFRYQKNISVFHRKVYIASYAETRMFYLAVCFRRQSEREAHVRVWQPSEPRIWRRPERRRPAEPTATTPASFSPDSEHPWPVSSLSVPFWRPPAASELPGSHPRSPLPPYPPPRPPNPPPLAYWTSLTSSSLLCTVQFLSTVARVTTPTRYAHAWNSSAHYLENLENSITHVHFKTHTIHSSCIECTSWHVLCARVLS